MITIHSTSNLPETQRRALAVLAAAAVPSNEWPRAVLLVGLTSIDAALAPARLVGAFWIGQGEADGLISSPMLHEYMRADVPVVVLCRSYADGQAIAAALGRERAA